MKKMKKNTRKIQMKKSAGGGMEKGVLHLSLTPVPPRKGG